MCEPELLGGGYELLGYQMLSGCSETSTLQTRNWRSIYAKSETLEEEEVYRDSDLPFILYRFFLEYEGIVKGSDFHKR